MLILTGDRIMLRDHIEADLHDMHDWMADDDVMHFLPGTKTISLEETRLRLAKNIAENSRPVRTRYFFAMLLKSGEIVGDAGFTVMQRSENGGVADMGYFLKKAYWGRGYAAEAAKLLIGFGFSELGLHKITAGCALENTRSERVMLKCGMGSKKPISDSMFSVTAHGTTGWNTPSFAK